jgi:hypothetical protein
MGSPDTPPVGLPDPALRPFLTAPDDNAAMRHLERILKEHVETTATAVLRRRGMWEGEEGADLLRDVVTQVATRLTALRQRVLPGEEAPQPVRDLRAYAAIAAYHVCDKRLREMRPERWRLSNRLRYLLTHQDGFSLWNERGEPVAGYAAWLTEKKTAAKDIDAGTLAFAAQAARTNDLAALVAAVFNRAGKPIPFDTLVAAMAEATGLAEPRRAVAVTDEETGGTADPYDRVADPTTDVEGQTERRQFLTRFWAEIRQLPPRQCAALLLNLRDDGGRGVIALLPMLGVATLREIAAAVDMEPAAFAAIWNDLPMEDMVIADLLGATRQQVINLRKVARERLARRMRE